MLTPPGCAELYFEQHAGIENADRFMYLLDTVLGFLNFWEQVNKSCLGLIQD